MHGNSRPRPAMLRQTVTPDSMVAPYPFPSTPQNTQHPSRVAGGQSADATAAQRVAFAQTFAPPMYSAAPVVSMPPRAKSSGDLAYRPVLGFAGSATRRGTAASPILTRTDTELNQSQVNVLQHRFLQVLQTQQRVDLHGVKVYREGFTDAFLGVATVMASPTDVVFQFPHQRPAAAVPTPQAASQAATATYAQWPPSSRSPTRSTPTGSPVLDSNVLRANRVAVADSFLIVPRLSLASVSFFPANAAGTHQNIGNGATQREPSAAVAFSSLQGKPCLELRTRDLHILTLVFAPNSKAHEPLVAELTRPEHPQYSLGPNRPGAYILYAGTQLAQRLQFPRQLILAASYRASINPTIAQKIVGGVSAAGPAEFSMPSCLAPAILPTLLLQTNASPTMSLIATSKPNTQQNAARPLEAAFSTATPASRSEPGTFPGGGSRNTPPVVMASGWFLYDPDQEFTRQCGRLSSVTASPVRSPISRTQPAFEDDDHHVVNAGSVCPVRRTSVNLDFSICPTYPPVFYVPSSVDDAMLTGEGKQRAKARIPVCAYYNSATQTSLYRSSQPQNGKDILTWIMTPETGKMTEGIRTSCPSQELKVVDLRPYVNAMVNSMFRNGGYETTRRKDKIEVFFANMENVDKVNAAFQEVFNLCATHHTSKMCSRSTASTPSAFSAALQRTGWLDLLSVCVSTAVKVARFLILGNNAVPGEQQVPVWLADQQAPGAAANAGLRTGSDPNTQTAHPAGGCNVLIHCSDGWDRTAQISALTQLLIDPYLRTLRGFCMLVEKEFLHYGHQFKSRSHHPWVTTGTLDPVDSSQYPLHANKPTVTMDDEGFGSKSHTPPPFLHADPAADVFDVADNTDVANRDDGWDASDQPFKRTPQKKSNWHGHCRNGGGGHEACPIFLQFIDAVRQLVEIYPHCFEFTEEALIWLLDAYHSGFYASFSGDCFQELTASGLVGRHTANAFAELAALGGVYPPLTPLVTATEAPSLHHKQQQQQQQDDRDTPGSFIEVDGSNLGDSVRPLRQETPDFGITAFGGVEDTCLRGSGIINADYSWHTSVAEGPLLGLIGPNRITFWSKYFLRFTDAMEPSAVPLRAPIPPELQASATQKAKASSAALRAVASTESLADWASTAGSAVTSPATHHTSQYPAAPHSPPRGPQPLVSTGRSGSVQSGDDGVSPARVAATRRHGPVGDMAPLPNLLSHSIADF